MNTYREDHCHYDPLINASPSQQAFASSYWADTVSLGNALPNLSQRLKVDVAVIGAGYTGLLTAYFLAKDFNVDVCVLEANQVGFGASARNAGFVLKGSGRLSYAQMTKRWGLDVTKGIYHEFSEGVKRVDSLIHQHQIKCEPQSKGYLKIAHSIKSWHQLQQSADFISSHLDPSVQLVNAQQLQTDYMQHQGAYGAMRLSDGFGVNPLKLVLGYKEMLLRQGVTLFENTCVDAWKMEQSKHRLLTSHGEVLADNVITAGNAYTPKQFNSAIDNHFLPILSNIIVTAPLCPSLLKACGLQTNQVAMDTRLLKYYYRLLPDNRLLFGGRGAIVGKGSHNPIYQQRLHWAMAQCFPALIQHKIDYNWTGWIAAALDDMPHVYAKDGIGYSLGYCGSGVSFSAQAAYRLAQQVTGAAVPALPLYNSPLPAFPFSKLRRVGQWGYYHYGWFKDKFFS